MKATHRQRFLCILLFLGAFCYAEGQERPAIGLALSGGGALGFAHIGLLQLLDSLDIPIDYIAGTSMGGLAGALYACGYSGKEIEQIAREVDWQEIFNDRPARPYLPYFQKKEAEAYQYEIGIHDFRPVDKGGVIAGQKIGLLFNRLVLPYLTVTDFDSLPTPFRCVAVDLISGREVVLKRGQLAQAMRATMAVPSIFSPVVWGDSLLIDGGLLNNLPADVVRDMGADFVIGSVVANPYKNRQDIRTFWDVLTQSYNILRDLKLDYNADKADILLRTELQGLNQADFTNARVERIIAIGKSSAGTILPQLLELKERYHLHRRRQMTIPSETPVIGKVILTGNQTIPRTAILDFLGLNEGEPFVKDSVQAAIQRLVALGDYRRIDWHSVPLDEQRVAIHIDLVEELHPLIHSIEIRGNQRLTFSFIYRVLGIQPGEIFSVNRLEERINHLYGLGYFNSINYTLEPVGFNLVRLVITVNEMPPDKIRLGLRYDNYHYLTTALAYQSTASWLQGMQLAAEWQFIGRDLLKLRLLYPTRIKDYPLYPFIELYTGQRPAYVYSTNSGRKIARYQDQATGGSAGWGFVYQNWWNITNAVVYEKVKAHPDIAPEDSSLFVNWRDEWWKIRVAADVDRVDDAFAPAHGSKWHLLWERVLWDAGRESRFTRYELGCDLYTTVQRHTWRLMIYGGRVNMQGFSNRFIYAGGPQTFLGLDYDQLVANQVILTRADWYYRIFDNSWFFLGVNAALFNRSDYLIPGRHLPNLTGGGMGVRILTPLGPLNLIAALGPRSLTDRTPRLRAYLSAGYNF